jgi:NADH-quinone oxidoreductase subunit E
MIAKRERLQETDLKLRQFESVLSIIENYNHDKARLITILQKVQHEYRYLPEEVLTYVATALDMPIAEVYGVATFYAHFTLVPKGKYVIKVCNGTACHVKGAMSLVDVLFKKLKLNEQKTTTDNMLFTVETVSCLGACGLAPVMVINEKVYGQVDNKKAEEIIEKLIQEEA